MTKKIAIIGTVGLPAKYGGFETLTEYLTKHLATQYEITVYCSSKAYPTKLKTYNHARLKYLPLHANGAQSIAYDIISIFNALLYADVLLILGVSGCMVLPLVKLISSKKIIVNIDGLEWKREKWRAATKWFLKFSEKMAVKHADVVIADNKVIQDYVWDSYQVKSEMVAYGADHTSKEILSKAVLHQFPFLNKKYAFKVCRIEPENNVHVILEAFSKCKVLNIVIVGNWNNSRYGKDLKSNFSKFANIYFLDPVYDQRILNQLRSNCHVYIHGHSAGGTNPSLVEAMYLGLPIVAYGVNYNKETTENKAVYFKDSVELHTILEDLMHLNLAAVGQHMASIAANRYRWHQISKAYAATF